MKKIFFLIILLLITRLIYVQFTQNHISDFKLEKLNGEEVTNENYNNKTINIIILNQLNSFTKQALRIISRSDNNNLLVFINDSSRNSDFLLSLNLNYFDLNEQFYPNFNIPIDTVKNEILEFNQDHFLVKRSLLNHAFIRKYLQKDIKADNEIDKIEIKEKVLKGTNDYPHGFYFIINSFNPSCSCYSNFIDLLAISKKCKFKINLILLEKWDKRDLKNFNKILGSNVEIRFDQKLSEMIQKSARAINIVLYKGLFKEELIFLNNQADYKKLHVLKKYLKEQNK